MIHSITILSALCIGLLAGFICGVAFGVDFMRFVPKLRERHEAKRTADRVAYARVITMMPKGKAKRLGLVR